MQQEGRFNFHRDVAGKGSHADRTARPPPQLFTKNLNHQIAEPVDDAGMGVKGRDGIHHSQDFDDAGNAVERAQLVPQSRQNGQPRDSRGGMGLLFGERLAHFAANHRTVWLEGAMAGNPRDPVNHDDWRINASRLGCCRQNKVKRFQTRLRTTHREAPGGTPTAAGIPRE